MKINRMLTTLCTTNLEESKRFYVELFDFKAQFSSDWFIQLVSEDKQFELGLLQANHELIPEQFRGIPRGMYLTLVVDRVDAIYEKASTLNFEIIQPPHATPYGQKRCLIKDPTGTLVDVSSPDSA
ncbi:MAG: VOC family protein [Chloroflexota bacterium]